MSSPKQIIKSRDLEAVKAFFALGNDVNAIYENGETALIMACEYQCLEIVDFLLSIGANSEIREIGGYTAMDIAYWHGEVRMGCYSKQCKAIVERLNASSKIT